MARHEGSLLGRRQFILGSGAMAGALLVQSETAAAETLPARSVATQTARQPGFSTQVATLPFREDFHDGLTGFLVKNWNKWGGVRLVGFTPFGDGQSLKGIEQPDTLRFQGLMLAFDDVLHGNVIPGRVVSAESFEFQHGHEYKLTYTVAGTHHAGRSGAVASTFVGHVPGVSKSVPTSLRNTDPFRTVDFTFSPSKTRRGQIEFIVEGPAGRSGVLLSSVQLAEA
jgi:hypothetical protein